MQGCVTIEPEVLETLFPASIAVTPQDLKCIEHRQLGRTVNGMLAVGKKCKHGYPQAFVRHPISYTSDWYGKEDKREKEEKTPGVSGSEIDRISVNSGMVRLSCPHLIKAIDELEAEGGLVEMNEKLAEEKEAKTVEEKSEQILRTSFFRVNSAWSRIRQAVMSEVDEKIAIAYLGPEGARRMIGSGIIGVTTDKVDDAKCLHAHVGDLLIRGDNQIGERTLDMVRDRDIDPSGCHNCWQQCSSDLPKEESGYWYVSRKNKEKLRTARDGRRKNRQTGRQTGSELR